MFASLLMLAMAFAETKTLAVQISLDRAGYSCGSIDGQWGRQSQMALTRFCADGGFDLPASPEAAYDALFTNAPALFRYETITAADLAALTDIIDDPAAKAQMDALGYTSIKEMMAERGHVSPRALERLNPNVVWENVADGTRILIPDFPRSETYLANSDNAKTRKRENSKTSSAARIRISLSAFTMSVEDEAGCTLAVFPCSIAKNKAKLPPHGELKLACRIPNPNYTYRPDHTPPGAKAACYVFPPGPNNPVGVAWMGLSLPGYGIHGTPFPERVGRAESHGCFRLANWNAARLYSLCTSRTRVLVEP